MQAERPLEGMLALVTGALGGLGPHWCATLLGAGARVVGVDAEEGEPPSGCRLVRAATRDQEALEAVLAEIGVPDVLVNGADHSLPGGPPTAPTLEGTLAALQVLGGAMRHAGRGAIVNIGSVSATRAPDLRPYPGGEPAALEQPAYGAAMAGVGALTRYFARLWGPHGVRVNTLSPGHMAEGRDEEFVRRYSAGVPMRRMAAPEDLAAPLVFLCSPASSYVNGAELHVDGGLTA